MVIDMNDEQLRTLADLGAFLDATVAMDFTAEADQRYEFIARAVRRFGYGRLKRSGTVVPRFWSVSAAIPANRPADWSNAVVSAASCSSATFQAA